MSYDPNDFIYKYAVKTKRYRLYCDACGDNRGYGMKSRAHLLCKSCRHHGKDYLRGRRDSVYRATMSRAKVGQVPWCKGKRNVYSQATLNKMRSAKISRNPCGDLVSASQQRIKRRCLSYLRRQIKYMQDGSSAVGRNMSTLFPFSFDEFVAHFSMKFTRGMTWDNYGRYGWHIDHVIPDSAFSYDSIYHEDFYRSWSLSNLQPLWARDNLIKSNKAE